MTTHPQLTPLVRQPVHSGGLLLQVSQQGTGSVQASEGDQSITGSRHVPEGITPFLNLKHICPWTSDIPQTLYKCNSLLCLERRCWASFDLFQTLSGVSWLFFDVTWNMKLTPPTWSWWYSTVYGLQKWQFCEGNHWLKLPHPGQTQYYLHEVSTRGDPSKEDELTRHHQLENSGKVKCLTNLPASSLLTSILAEWCAHCQEVTWVRMTGQRKSGN